LKSRLVIKLPGSSLVTNSTAARRHNGYMEKFQGLN
jgi:hypothetical protein